jgi:hypothetical protein
MQNRNLKNMPLWKLALRLGIVFILIVMLIQFFWEWIKTGNLGFFAEAFKNGNWIYLIPYSKLILATVYGLTSAYFLKRNAA